MISGVVRVPYAMGQGIILRPLSTKTTNFEMKNRCKSAEEEKTITVSYFVPFLG